MGGLSLTVNIETVSRPLIDSSRTVTKSGRGSHHPSAYLVDPGKSKELMIQTEMNGTRLVAVGGS